MAHEIKATNNHCRGFHQLSYWVSSGITSGSGPDKKKSQLPAGETFDKSHILLYH